MKGEVYPQGDLDPRSRRAAAWCWPQILGVSFCFISFNPVWRFGIQLIPKIGSAYIVAYVVMGFLIGLPLLFVQVKLGGVSNQNVIGVLSRRIPIFKGLGIALLLKAFIQVILLQVSLGHVLFYMTRGLREPYEWGSEEHGNNPGAYYLIFFLRFSPSMFDVSPVLTHQVVPLLFAWMFTFLLVLGGPKVFGWVMTVIAGFILVSVLAFIGFACNRLGEPHELAAAFSSAFSPNWFSLLRAGITAESGVQVWWKAASDVIFTLSCLTGVLPSVGKFCGGTKVRLAVSWLPIWLVAIFGPLVIICGFATFLPKVAGSGFALIQMPLIFSQTGVAPFWTFLFYAIIFLTGASAMALVVLVVVDVIFDSLFRHHRGRCAVCCRVVVSLVVCVAGFLLGILHCTRAGRVWSEVCNRSLELFGFLFIILLAILFIVCYGRESHIHCLERTILSVWFGLACLFITVMALMGTISSINLGAGMAGVMPFADTSIYGSPMPQLQPPMPQGFQPGQTRGPSPAKGLGGPPKGDEPPALPAPAPIDENKPVPEWTVHQLRTIQIVSWLTALGPLVLGLTAGMLHACLDTMVNDKHNQYKCAKLCCAISDDGIGGDTEFPEYPETPTMGKRQRPPGIDLDYPQGIPSYNNGIVVTTKL